MRERPILTVVLDGVGDRPCPVLDGSTPLEAAQVPTLDALAREGSCGLIDPLAPGVVPGSGTGHLGLFGYDPLGDLDATPSRGCIEALGLGIEPAEGLVATRGNFATVEDGGVIVDRRAGRFGSREDHEEAKVLVEAMNEATSEGVSFAYHPRMAYRFVVLLEDASPLVSDTDPGEVGAKPVRAEALVDGRDAREAADRLWDAVETASGALAKHVVNEDREGRGAPVANRVLTRGMGPVVRGETLRDRFGLDAAAVAGGNAYRGFASFVGMRLVDVPGALGDLSSDWGAKVEAALDALEEHDLVFLHIKAPDILGENGDAEGKRDVLERIDEALAPVLEVEEAVVGVTGDHSTPCARAHHSADPVPLVFRAPGGRVDEVGAFNESACAGGSLGRLVGGDFLRSLLDLADRTKKTE